MSAGIGFIPPPPLEPIETDLNGAYCYMFVPLKSKRSKGRFGIKRQVFITTQEVDCKTLKPISEK